MIIAISIVSILISLGSAIYYSLKLGESRGEVYRLQSRLTDLKAQRDSLESSRPICLCSHGVNVHREGGGRCDQVLATGSLPMLDSKCGCKRYTGPEPLPTYYAQLT